MKVKVWKLLCLATMLLSFLMVAASVKASSNYFPQGVLIQELPAGVFLHPMGITYNPHTGTYWSISGGTSPSQIYEQSRNGTFLINSTVPLDGRQIVYRPEDGNIYIRAYDGGLYRLNMPFNGTVTLVLPNIFQNVQCGFTFADGGNVFDVYDGLVREYNFATGNQLRNFTLTPIYPSNATYPYNCRIASNGTDLYFFSAVDKVYAYGMNGNLKAVVSLNHPTFDTFNAPFSFSYANAGIYALDTSVSKWYGYKIMALVAPSVSSSPGTVEQGQTSILNSTAVTTAVAPYTYQWFSEAPGVSSYLSIGGATSSSYNFVTSTSTATGSWSFILQVTDATGAAVNSTAATVTVSVGPTVSITPASVTMDVGQSKNLTAVASGGASPYSYRWYLNGVANGTSSSWTFTPSSAGSYSVYVNVTDSTGVKTKSNVASVTVSPALSVTVSPSSVTVGVGHSKTFNPSVSGGTPPYSYQWYLNGSHVVGAGVDSSFTQRFISTGVYIIYVKTTDAANNTVQSSNVQVKVTAAGLGLIWVALIGVVVVAVACVGVVGYKMRKRPKKPPPTPPPPTPTKLMIQAEPTEIVADGKSTSTITVQLKDDRDRLTAALADTEVKITATRGTLETPAVKIIKGKDTETTVITSSTETGPVTVSAKASGLKTMSTTLNFAEKKRFCMHCGVLIPFRATRCPRCGKAPPAGLDTKVCKNCKAVVPVVAKFCSECGAGQAE